MMAEVENPGDFSTPRNSNEDAARDPPTDASDVTMEMEGPGDFGTPRDPIDDDDSDETREGSSVLNETLLNSSKHRTAIYVEKTESVEESETKGKLAIERKESRRTVLQRKLGTEVFDSPTQPIFQQKKSGFLTDRPIAWMTAVEKYIQSNDDVNGKWRYKMEGELFSECEIVIWFATTTEVTLTISLMTGVLMVKGPQFRKFINNEFSKISMYVIGEGCVQTIQTHEAETDLESVWDSIHANKNAIHSAEDSILKLLEISEASNQNNNEVSALYRADILKLEKSYDSKLQTFMDTYDKEVKKKIQNICKAFDDKLSNMKTMIGAFKISSQNQINDLCCKRFWKFLCFNNNKK